MRTLHEKQTSQFVDMNPAEISLVRWTKVDDGAGGVKRATSKTLDPQVFRMVGSGRLGATTTRTDENGRIRIVEYTLVGMPHNDIELGDTFTFEDNEYEVLGVNRTPSWAVRAEVSLRG